MNFFKESGILGQKRDRLVFTPQLVVETSQEAFGLTNYRLLNTRSAKNKINSNKSYKKKKKTTQAVNILSW